MNSYKILVVEDEKNICNFMKMIFETNDYQVIFAQNGKNGLTMFFSHNPDLVILDLGLPDMDGVDVIREIRAKNDTPIVVLSARTDESDKVEALDLGANDYVTKPFTPMELMARVNSQLRRYHRFLDRLNSGQKENPKIHQVGGLEVNEETVEVNADGKNVKVTPIEFKILLLLIRNPGRVFPAEEIYERVWNERAINTDTVMVHIRNLREKIEVDPKDPKYIKVVWGVGYKLEKQ